STLVVPRRGTSLGGLGTAQFCLLPPGCRPRGQGLDDANGESMKLLLTSRYLLGATTLLALGASAALAQDTSKASPRSQQRIPISKDAPSSAGRTSSGTVERGGSRTPPRVDTVTVYKTDTLR